MESVKSGNLPLGILAGTGAALVGALIWMGITVLSGLHIGYVAIAVRYAGQGSTPIFGVVGAVLTLIGCVLGEILAVIQLAANGAQIGFFTALSHVDPFKFLPAIFENSSPITYFIYAIGIFEGYKLARKK
jgi:hypothetical protein